MKQKKYLKFYRESMERNWFRFLCHEFHPDDDKLFALVQPTFEELNAHEKDGYLRVAWGCKPEHHSGEPTPLRQNIVLLLAAMNNEL